MLLVHFYDSGVLPGIQASLPWEMSLDPATKEATITANTEANYRVSF